MSTKVYNGFKFKSNNIIEILQLCKTLKIDIVDKANELLEIDDIAEFIILNKIQDKSSFSILNTIKNNLDLRIRNRCDINFKFTISVIPSDDGIYGYYFDDFNGQLYEFLKEHTEDFSYWDNTDEPENMSKEEWYKRKNIWDKILGYDSFTDASFLYEFVTSSNIHYNKTIEKIEQALKLIKQYKNGEE